jgi:hypothetical protein
MDWFKNLNAAPRLLVSFAAIREALPGYENSYQSLIERVNANDTAGAIASLVAANTTGRPLFQAVDDLRRLKHSLGKKKFQVNQEQFQTARMLLLSAATIGLLLGVAFSIFIAQRAFHPLGPDGGRSGADGRRRSDRICPGTDYRGSGADVRRLKHGARKTTVHVTGCSRECCELGHLFA